MKGTLHFKGNPNAPTKHENVEIFSGVHIDKKIWHTFESRGKVLYRVDSMNLRMWFDGPNILFLGVHETAQQHSRVLGVFDAAFIVSK